MRRIVLVLAVAALLVWQSPIFAVGTVTVTTADIGGGITRYTVAWTSTAGGAVSANTFAVKKGHLIHVKFVPGSGGTQPTDLYDVTLVDADSLDVLNGGAANLSNATPKILQADPLLLLNTATLDVVVANAGASKTGTVTIYVGP